MFQQQQQIPEYASRSIPPGHVSVVAGNVQTGLLQHGGGAVAAGVRPGMPTAVAGTGVAAHTLVYTGLAPAAARNSSGSGSGGGTAVSRDPRQHSSSSSDPRHAAATAAGVRPTGPAQDPRHAAASSQAQQYGLPQLLQSQPIHQHRHMVPVSSSQQAAATRRGQALLQTPGHQQKAPPQQQTQFPFQAPGFFQG